MQRGDLIGLVEAGQPRIGVVIAVDGKRLHVCVGAASKRLKVPGREVVLLAAFQSFVGLDPEAVPPERIAAFPWHLDLDALRATTPQRRDCAAAWLLLGSSPAAIPFSEWVGLIWNEPTPAQCAGSWLWLHGEQLWFSHRHGQISARSLAELRQCRAQRRREHQRAQAEARWFGCLQRRLPLTAGDLDDSQRQDLTLLQLWAQGNTEQPLPAALLRGLKQAHCAPESGAIRHLLVDLGQWDAHALPALRRSPWSEGFSPELEAHAAQWLEQLEDPRDGDEHRVDRTLLHCVTIDDADSQDIDDALGLELNEAGRPRIWIHIADPGRLIQQDDPLDREAQRRGSSLYLARGILPMFPWALSTQGLSLVAGKRCAAWSIWAELADDGSLAAYGIERTWIKPTYRLSYADADELIELAPPQEAALVNLDALMQRRRQWRHNQGALLLDQPEGRIQLEDGSLCLRVVEPSAARLMVAEAMILAGAVVAQHGADLGLALPYRSQGPPVKTAPPPPPNLPPGPVRHAWLKQGLSRGLTASSPAPHYSLGLAAYVQATSPIRRYADLLVQRQLASVWQGERPMDASELAERLNRVDDPLRQGVQISRDDQRHWRQVWFEQHRTNQWRGQFLRWLRESDQLGLVWLDELAMELPAQCPSNCQPADALLIHVHRVDPLQDCLQLRAHH